MTKAKLFTATFNRMKENIKEINVAEIFVTAAMCASDSPFASRALRSCAPNGLRCRSAIVLLSAHSRGESRHLTPGWRAFRVPVPPGGRHFAPFRPLK